MDFKDDNFVCFGKLFLNRRDVLHPILPNKKKTKPKIKSKPQPPMAKTTAHPITCCFTASQERTVIFTASGY